MVEKVPLRAHGLSLVSMMKLLQAQKRGNTNRLGSIASTRYHFPNPQQKDDAHAFSNMLFSKREKARPKVTINGYEADAPISSEIVSVSREKMG